MCSSDLFLSINQSINIRGIYNTCSSCSGTKARSLQLPTCTKPPNGFKRKSLKEPNIGRCIPFHRTQFGNHFGLSNSGQSSCGGELCKFRFYGNCAHTFRGLCTSTFESVMHFLIQMRSEAHDSVQTVKELESQRNYFRTYCVLIWKCKHRHIYHRELRTKEYIMMKIGR